MGIVIRQSIKSSVVSYVGVLLGAFNILFLFPYYLSQREIGLINLLESIALMLATFSALGVNQIADRYFPHFRDADKKHHGYLIFLITWNLIGFGFSGSIFWLFKDFWLSFYRKEAPEVALFFWVIILFAFSISASNLLESYSRIHLRIVVPNLLRQVGIRVLITLSIIIYALGWTDFFGLVLCRVFAYASMAILMIFYLRNLRVLFLKIDLSIFKSSFFQEMLVFAVFIVVGGASSVIVNKIDVLMIGALLETKELGIYSIAYFVGTVVEIPRQMLSQIITPIISQAWADQDLVKIAALYKKSSVSQAIIGFLLFLGIWASLDDLFELMPNGSAYISGKYVVFFVGLTRMLDTLGGINYEILVQSKYYKFNLTTVMVLAMFIVVTNLIFIPYFGIVGAAFATFISYFIYNVIKIVFLWYKFRIHPFSYKTFLILGIGLSVFLMTEILPEIPGIFFNIIFKSVLIFIVFVGLIYLSKVSEEYNLMADSFLRKLLRLIQKLLRR